MMKDDVRMPVGTQSPDGLLASQLAEAVSAVAPQAITDGKVDLEQLKQALGEHVETRRERYGLTWPGKAEAIKAAQRPSLGTLRPKVGEGINEASTGNLIIEGDNLEVLKLLQKAYLGKIKMIYIDPPYNTGNDFVYEDNFADPLAGYLEQTRQTVDGKRLSTNTETAGRYHSNWLSMMYPRLTLARNLLREDGVILIHIDENEYSALEFIMREIFGEESLLGTIVWDKRNPKGDVAGVSYQHEYILAACRNALSFQEAGYFTREKLNARAMIELVKSLVVKHGGVTDLVREEYVSWLKLQGEKLSGGESAYSLIDSAGEIYRPVSMAAPDKPETRSHRPLIHPVTGKPCPVPAKGWRFKDENLDRLLKQSQIIFGPDESTQPTRKYLLSENLREGWPSLLYFGGSGQISDLPFDNPKPVFIGKRFVEAINGDDAIILDFFAGSGTTAQAVLEMNEEDGGNRKFILVQLPEVVDEDSAAAKAGFANIAEITKERVRRVIKKLDGGTKDGLGLDGTKNLDRGFKVYALDRSNFVPWDATAATDAASLEKQLELAVDNVLHDRSDADLLAEILLKTGFPLDTAITKVTIAGTPVYQVADPGFLVCLAKKVDAPLIKAIAAAKPHRVVILDAAFQGNDALKTNAVQAFKDQGVEMFRTA